MLISNTSTAYAYVTTGYVLNGGVGNYGYTNRYYYVDSSCTSTMSSDIRKNQQIILSVLSILSL